MRGTIDQEPTYVRGSGEDPLRSFPTSAYTRFVLQVTRLKTADDWLDVSGLAQVTLEARVHPVHVGDRVEIDGRMAVPHPPANPGEFDYRTFLLDQGISVTVSVPSSPEGIRLLAEGWPGSLFGWLAVLRQRCQETLTKHLPGVDKVGCALILGEGSGMTGEDWDKYVRAGVVHVLAISGQQLVVLAWFLFFVSRVFGFSRRRTVLVMAVFLFFYGLMAGGRPPVMRAVWAMAACAGAAWLRRPSLPANTFALAWIAIIVTSPTDIFNLGCQLSFLAVAILFWGTTAAVQSSPLLYWLPMRQTNDPALQKVIDESRPLLLQFIIRCWRIIVAFYVINATVWLAVTPLVAGTQHLISPVALLIGPPVVLLTSVALISGFVTLLFAPFCLAALISRPAAWCLAGCEKLVDLALTVPGATIYLPQLPAWWMWGIYLGLFAFLTSAGCRRQPRRFAGLGIAWLCLGLLIVFGAFRSHAFRCTFLAVGHGGCTVIETKTGRVLIYDAGALGGPDVTRRFIAPYLWQRGIRRIDDLLISHADLDHFNGVSALLERFTVDRVILTPSFAECASPGVGATMGKLRRRGLATQIVKAGDLLEEGRIEVVHPPAQGPDGNENARSLVLRIREEDLSVLLTGDLEGEGLRRVLSLPRSDTSALMAPHHGSKTSNTPELAAWANPKVVVSCQGPPRGHPKTLSPFESAGATYLTTWQHGAVTIRRHAGKWVVETHLTKAHLEIE